MDGDNREIFHPTNGRTFGVLAVLLGVGGVVLACTAAGGVIWWLLAGGAFFAVLSWCAMLRPRVMVTAEHLVLRNLVDTVSIPLAGIEEAVVRQVLAVRVGEKRFTSPAVGRSRRQIRKDDRRPGVTSSSDLVRQAEESYGLYIEERIRAVAQDAREQRGIKRSSPEQAALADEVVRDLALPEIVGLAVSAVAFVVSVVV